MICASEFFSHRNDKPNLRSEKARRLRYSPVHSRSSFTLEIGFDTLKSTYYGDMNENRPEHFSRFTVRRSMHSTPSSLDLEPERAWRRFWLLLGMFFVASCFASLIPTPGSWSDTRSQWLSPAAMAFTALIFLFTAQWIYWRGGPLGRVQIWVLSVLFGAVLVLVVSSLWECIAFMRDVFRPRSGSP